MISKNEKLVSNFHDLERVNKGLQYTVNITRSNEPLISAGIFDGQGFYKMARNEKFGRQNGNPQLNPTRICVDVFQLVHWLDFSHVIKVLVYWFIRYSLAQLDRQVM